MENNKLLSLLKRKTKVPAENLLKAGDNFVDASMVDSFKTEFKTEQTNSVGTPSETMPLTKRSSNKKKKNPLIIQVEDQFSVGDEKYIVEPSTKSYEISLGESKPSQPSVIIKVEDQFSTGDEGLIISEKQKKILSSDATTQPPTTTAPETNYDSPGVQKVAADLMKHRGHLEEFLSALSMYVLKKDLTKQIPFSKIEQVLKHMSKSSEKEAEGTTEKALDIYGRSQTCSPKEHEFHKSKAENQESSVESPLTRPVIVAVGHAASTAAKRLNLFSYFGKISFLWVILFFFTVGVFYFLFKSLFQVFWGSLPKETRKLLTNTVVFFSFLVFSYVFLYILLGDRESMDLLFESQSNPTANPTGKPVLPSPNEDTPNNDNDNDNNKKHPIFIFLFLIFDVLMKLIETTFPVLVDFIQKMIKYVFIYFNIDFPLIQFPTTPIIEQKQTESKAEEEICPVDSKPLPVVPETSLFESDLVVVNPADFIPPNLSFKNIEQIDYPIAEIEYYNPFSGVLKDSYADFSWAFFYGTLILLSSYFEAFYQDGRAFIDDINFFSPSFELNIENLKKNVISVTNHTVVMVVALYLLKTLPNLLSSYLYQLAKGGYWLASSGVSMLWSMCKFAFVWGKMFGVWFYKACGYLLSILKIYLTKFFTFCLTSLKTLFKDLPIRTFKYIYHSKAFFGTLTCLLLYFYWNNIAQLLVSLWKIIGPSLQGLLNYTLPFLLSLWNTISPYAIAFWNLISPYITTFFSTIIPFYLKKVIIYMNQFLPLPFAGLGLAFINYLGGEFDPSDINDFSGDSNPTPPDDSEDPLNSVTLLPMPPVSTDTTAYAQSRPEALASLESRSQLAVDRLSADQAAFASLESRSQFATNRVSTELDRHPLEPRAPLERSQLDNLSLTTEQRTALAVLTHITTNTILQMRERISSTSSTSSTSGEIQPTSSDSILPPEVNLPVSTLPPAIPEAALPNLTADAMIRGTELHLARRIANFFGCLLTETISPEFSAAPTPEIQSPPAPDRGTGMLPPSMDFSGTRSEIEE